MFYILCSISYILCAISYIIYINFRKYPDISSYDQRNSFKNDFNDDYPEYITLFEHFKKKYNDKFQRLADRLRASAPGSGEYKVSLYEVQLTYILC